MIRTVDGKTYDTASAVNREIKQQLIRDNVLENVTAAVRAFQAHGEMRPNDFCNSELPLCPDCRKVLSRNDSGDLQCAECGRIFTLTDGVGWVSVEDAGQVPHSYYVVAEKLALLLGAVGGMLYEVGDDWIWGRTTVSEELEDDFSIDCAALLGGFLVPSE